MAWAAPLLRTWEDTRLNETSFLIERRAETEETFTPLDMVDVNVTAYFDYTTEAGLTYCYQVRAVNAQEDSASSSEACSQAQ